ncbi:hypothetical protein ACRALDRAFT_2055199 [Sodiomyces alcalophilus JCM 7366]|uniref:uncharacterized protein n=1 Tax=Sodiomyces alcalophilus JCM 7366 TaxID=591952 RepID=UPI0039B58F5E
MSLESSLASSLAIPPPITTSAAPDGLTHNPFLQCEDSLQPCGEYCIGRDSVCCSYTPPERGYFVCPAGYECGPDTDCRPIIIPPVCPEFLKACGSLCIPATNVCCGDGKSSCPIGFVCASSPLGCVESKADDDDDDDDDNDDDVSSTPSTVTVPSSLPSDDECLPIPTGAPGVVSSSWLLSGGDENDSHSATQIIGNLTFCTAQSCLFFLFLFLHRFHVSC